MRKYTDEAAERRMTAVVPSERQLRLMSMEFYAFVHFTVNTFTGREWGDGTEDEAIFDPVLFDAEQWCRALVSAGMKGLILTCKHHDGFCLWPSRYTKHTVASSPFRDGKGDIVKEVSEACRKYGLRFGVYLSPWDRNNAAYGSGKPYNDYFCAQLEELLTGYGDICSVWFDGACGEGPNGKKQVYDWERYYALIRRLQPEACIHVCGPDIRWCGNEAGFTRKAEWSVVPERTRDTEKIAQKSQQEDDAAFRERRITASDEDLGSFDLIRDEERLVWYPAEVNTSIRPGWFYHDFEDERVKSLEELIRVYEGSVGGNATFLLNIPPAPTGLFHENDVARLAEFGGYLKAAYGKNLLSDARLTCGEELTGYGVENLREDSYETYFRTAEGVRSCSIHVSFPAETEVSRVVLKENVKLSQRVEGFRITADDGRLLTEGPVIGYKKIAAFGPVRVKGITIEITDARIAPTLAFIGVYE